MIYFIEDFSFGILLNIQTILNSLKCNQTNCPLISKTSKHKLKPSTSLTKLTPKLTTPKTTPRSTPGTSKTNKSSSNNNKTSKTPKNKSKNKSPPKRSNNSEASKKVSYPDPLQNHPIPNSKKKKFQNSKSQTRTLWK